jgi:hypothetical protein
MAEFQDLCLASGSCAIPKFDAVACLPATPIVACCLGREGCSLNFIKKSACFDRSTATELEALRRAGSIYFFQVKTDDTA